MRLRRPRRARRWCASTATSRRSSGRSWRAGTSGCGTCRSPTWPTPSGRTPGWWPTRSSSRAPARSPTAAAVAAAARASGARVLVDVTQAAGWLPITDVEADLVVCHTYKWLCAPRGSAFAAFSDRAQEEIRPLTAGWYSAADPWASCYGPSLDLAPDASRYDVSPAWPAWVGAEAALGFAVSLDPAEVHDHAVGLANAFRERLDLGPSNSAIVSWPDPGGAHLAAFGAAGVTASGRAGRARVSFHLWNDEEDVDLAARTLGR